MLRPHQRSTVRKRVMRELLLPVGFVAYGSQYFRVTDGQIHFIEFQSSQNGPEFTVNVAFHYEFLPGFINCVVLPVQEMHLLDHLIYGRPGSMVVEGRRHTFWPFGDTTEVAEANFRTAALLGLNILDRFAVEWRDPAFFIEKLPPRMLRPHQLSTVRKRETCTCVAGPEEPH